MSVRYIVQIPRLAQASIMRVSARRIFLAKTLETVYFNCPILEFGNGSNFLWFDFVRLCSATESFDYIR